MDLSSEGAKRQRPVGRYKLDSRGNPDFSGIFVRLRDAIDDHIKKLVSTTARPETATIYLVNSLSGGTGSGTFPLFAMLLSRITDEIEKTRNIPTYTFGIGVTPQLGAEGEFTFRGNPVYYANTYASLRDIETMLEEPSPDKPLSVEIQSEEQQKRSSDQRVAQYLDADRAIELSRAPFDNYFLVGVNEGLIGEPPGQGRMEGYNEVVDNTIAETINALSRCSRMDCNLLTRGSSFGGFRQSEVAVPVDLLREYCKRRERANNLNERAEELKQQHTAISARIESIDVALESPARAFGGDAREYITDKLDDCLGRGQALAVNGVDEDIRSIVEDVGDHYQTANAPEQRHLIQLFTLKRVKTRLDDAAETIRRSRTDLVSTMWENLNMTETEHGDPDEDEWTISSKADVMESHLQGKIEEYEQPVEDDGYIRVITDILGLDNEAREWLEYYRTQLNDLQDIQLAYRRVTALFDAHRDARRSVKADLNQVQEELVERQCDLRDEVESIKRQASEFNQELQSLRHDIERPNYESRLGYLPITNLEQIDSRKLENELTDLAAFVDGNYVSESEFEAAIETQVEDALAEDNPIMSQTVPAGETNTDKYLFWAMYSDEFADSDYTEYIPSPTVFGASCPVVPPRIDDPYRISFVSFLVNDSLEQFDVYRKLKDAATTGRLNSALPEDWDCRLSFAYPEWYGRGSEFDGSPTELHLPMPPALEPKRVRGDFDTEDDKMNYIVSNAFDSYLWNGTLADGYDGNGISFEGWKEKLEPHDISYHNLQEVTPESRKISNWFDGAIEWKNLVHAFATNLTDQRDVEVEFTASE